MQDDKEFIGAIKGYKVFLMYFFQLVLPETKIHSVHYSKTTKKLLLRMSDECKR